MFSIGEASRMTGLSVETIRYYEREDIIPPPGRAANGRRVYAAVDLERLHFVRRCRALGFPMSQARDLLALSECEGGACDRVHKVALAHLETVRAKIAELTELEATIEKMISQCRAGAAVCPVLDDLRCPNEKVGCDAETEVLA